MAEIIPVRCPLHTDFYVCGNGFRGCCAEDPCKSQLCLYGRDQEFSSPAIAESAIETTAVTSTKTTTAGTATTATETAAGTTPAPTPATATTVVTTLSTSTSSATESSTPSVSTAPTSVSTTAVPEETTETQPTSAANAAALSSSQSHVNPGMIGGIVAGVVCLMLIIGLVFFRMRRSSRKRGRRFTLLHWKCPRTENTQGNIEGGDTTNTTEVQPLVWSQPPTTAVSSILTRPAYAPLRTIPEEQSPGISLLQGSQTNSPRTIPSVVSPPGRSSQSRPNSCSKADLMPHPRTPDAIHPAFRQDTYLTPESILTKAIPPAPIIRRVSSTPELSDTGIRLGRLELPATTTRELINIPLAERQRHIAQKQLYRNAGLPSPIITPDGAVLSANFNSLPVDTDSHAMSFMNYGESSERGRGLRLSLMSKRKSTTTQLLSPSQSQSPGPLSPPPLYRAEWRKSSKEVKEKMKEAFRRKP